MLEWKSSLREVVSHFHNNFHPIRFSTLSFPSFIAMSNKSIMYALQYPQTLAEQTSSGKKVIIKKVHTESPVNVMSCSQMLKSRLPVSKLSSKIKSPLQIFFSFTALIPLVVVTLFSHFVIAARTTAELMENMRNVIRNIAIFHRKITFY